MHGQQNIEIQILVLGHAISQDLCYWLLSALAQVRSQVSWKKR